jgi:hypothetical protein
LDDITNENHDEDNHHKLWSQKKMNANH